MFYPWFLGLGQGGKTEETGVPTTVRKRERPKTNQAKERLVLRLRDEGCSYRSIREQTGLALSTIRRIIAEQEAVTC